MAPESHLVENLESSTCAAADSGSTATACSRWIGTAVTTNPPGVPPFPATDIYISNTRKPGHTGTVLCTIPGGTKVPIFVDGQPPLAYFVWQLPTG